MLWLRIKEWFQKGIDRLKWFASLFSERLHIELAIVKLLNNIETLKKKRAELVLRIGERVIQLKDSPTHHDVLTDHEVKSLLKEVEAVDKEIETEKGKVKDLSKLED